MKSLIAALGALLVALSPAVHAGGTVGATVGARVLDEDYWSPVDDHMQVGFMANLGIGESLLHLSVGAQVSGDTSSGKKPNHAATLREASLGLLLMAPKGLFRPFVGGGVVHDAVKVTDRVGGARRTTNDSTDGYYANAGVLFLFARHVVVGTEVRFIRGTELGLFGQPGNADATSANVTAGFGW